MKILVVSATETEVAPLKKLMRGRKHIDFLITGVGMTATAYELAKHLAKEKYDLVINIGVAGSFKKEIGIGEVVNVTNDCFGDLGAQDGNKFLSWFEIGLNKKNQFPFRNGMLSPKQKKYVSLKQLRNAKAITVNTVHGEEESIRQAVKKFNPDIESMEGAAFFYVCMLEKIPCIQLRSISNYVERRNKAKWNIPLALVSLHKKVNELIADCTHEL